MDFVVRLQNSFDSTVVVDVTINTLSEQSNDNSVLSFLALQHPLSTALPSPPESKPTISSHPFYGRYTTITTPVSKTICTPIPLNIIPRPHIPPLRKPKQELPPRTTNKNSRKPTTTTGTIRQLFTRKMRVLKFCAGPSVKNTGTPTSQKTESALIETGKQSMLPLTVLDGLGRELPGVFFGSS